jgi:hypothetical protein
MIAICSFFGTSVVGYNSGDTGMKWSHRAWVNTMVERPDSQCHIAVMDRRGAADVVCLDESGSGLRLSSQRVCKSCLTGRYHDPNVPIAPDDIVDDPIQINLAPVRRSSRNRRLDVDS